MVLTCRQEAADGAKKGAMAFYFAIFFCKDYRKQIAGCRMVNET